MIQVLSEHLTVFLEEARQAAIYCMHSTVNTSLIKSLCGELNTVKANILFGQEKKISYHFKVKNRLTDTNTE